MAVLFFTFVILNVVHIVTNNMNSSGSDVTDQNVLHPPTEEQMLETEQQGTYYATIETEAGIIELELAGERMPLTVTNFVNLASANFYHDLVFHRVEDWVIQGGDPAGTGAGGPGYTINLETHPELLHLRGAVAMARSRNPDSAGSQFFILRSDAPWLDGDYAVFGQVTAGMDVVDNITQNTTIHSVMITK